jgi:NAD(P)-dependent dehydrogenase (short-subunit alcohol dehydrogenase family)
LLHHEKRPPDIDGEEFVELRNSGFLVWSITSRPLKGDAPTIDLVLGYKKSNESPVLELLLSRLDESSSLVFRRKLARNSFEQSRILNVRGTLFTVQKALPLFSNGGSIFLNGSIASIKGFPNFSVYSASKAAVRSFARTWLVDLKERKIRVNILSPGTIDTPILDPLGPGAKEYFASLIPRGEIGRPEEIATVALFLASSDSNFVNGVELFVDGGTAQI